MHRDSFHSSPPGVVFCFSAEKLTEDTASHEIKFRAITRKHLHPLHLRDSVHPWHERRPRLIPRFPRQLILNTCAHGRQTRRHQISPVRYTFFFSPPIPTLHINQLNPDFQNTTRMWIVEPHSPSPTVPASPSPQSQPAVFVPPHPAYAAQANPPFLPLASTPVISAAALPGQHLAGHLSGVISLTDILNLYARASGLHPADLEEARRKRRGSSSSSTGASAGAGAGAGVRGSLDSARGSSVDIRERR